MKDRITLPATIMPSSASGITIVGKKLSQNSDKNQLVKSAARIGPSSYRQLLPIVLCLISFATVLSILIIYMDTTEFRHQQFRLNMSRDLDFYGVAQDNPYLVTYVRELHIAKPLMPSLKNFPVVHMNFTDQDLIAKIGGFIVSDLLDNKKNGVFFESYPGGNDVMMTAPWLEEKLGWTGYIVEPDPRKFFHQRKMYMSSSTLQPIHSCLSPNDYPKEVIIHHDKENDVKIHRLFESDSESDWFYTRVKCFPLYTLLLAVNQTTLDLLSLGCNRQELEILQTLPFERVNIRVITIYLREFINDNENESLQYVHNLTTFLKSKSYQLIKVIENNYIYLKSPRKQNNL